MIVHGQGGTGKTTMLNAISDLFNSLGVSHLLAKMAMSGVAASLIGRQTLHSWAALPVRKPVTEKWIMHPSKEIGTHCKQNFGVLWLLIDEMSMMTTLLLDFLSQATGVVCTGIQSVDLSIAFGGLSIMLLGDFHQLLPMANSERELYYSFPPDDSSTFGRSFYEQFDVVIKLEEQMRITDVEWDAILKRAQMGDCTKDDMEELRKLVLANSKCVMSQISLLLHGTMLFLLHPGMDLKCFGTIENWKNIVTKQDTLIMSCTHMTAQNTTH
jgi:hypothetical protein